MKDNKRYYAAKIMTMLTKITAEDCRKVYYFLVGMTGNAN